MALPGIVPKTVPNRSPPNLPRKTRKECPVWGAKHRFTIRTSTISKVLKEGAIVRQWKCRCGAKIWLDDPKKN